MTYNFHDTDPQHKNHLTVTTVIDDSTLELSKVWWDWADQTKSAITGGTASLDSWWYWKTIASRPVVKLREPREPHQYKWYLIPELLQQAKHVLYMDVMSILYRNPITVLERVFKTDDNGNVVGGPLYDLLLPDIRWDSANQLPFMVFTDDLNPEMFVELQQTNDLQSAIQKYNVRVGKLSGSQWQLGGTNISDPERCVVYRPSIKNNDPKIAMARFQVNNLIIY